MMSHSTASATQALRAHYPRLTILVLAFTARLVLAGCATTPAVLEPIADITGEPSPHVLNALGTDEAQVDSNASVVVRSLEELTEANQEERAAEDRDDLEARHDFIPGC